MRPLAFDTTHIIARIGIPSPTGIDRVDHAYAREFCLNGGMTVGVRCLLNTTKLHTPAAVAGYVAQLSGGWRETITPEQDPAWRVFRDFVLDRVPGNNKGTDTGADTGPRRRTEGAGQSFRVRLQRYRSLAANMLRSDPGCSVPHGALFLNVTQNPTLVPYAGAYLRTRPDLRAVFLVHDLIPIDYPEFFAEGRKNDFTAVLDVMFAHAKGFIVTTQAVHDRLAEEQRRRGAAPVPIHVAPLPLGDGDAAPVQLDPALLDCGYMLAVGTIEPRKNHWLLLNLWREMIAAEDKPPKLVLVGALGWENDMLRAMLDRTPEFEGRVLHVSGLGNAGLRSVIAHARALLMPSFVEGYGLPIIEAAALGTPIIASSGTVFGDVSQGHARLVHPLDGPGWRSAVLDTQREPSPKAGHSASSPLKGFVVPTEQAYFASIRTFLTTLD